MDVQARIVAASDGFAPGASFDGAAGIGTATRVDGLAVSSVAAPGAGTTPFVVFSYPLPREPQPAAPLYLAVQVPAGTIARVLDAGPGLPSGGRHRLFDVDGHVIAASPDAPASDTGRDISDSALWAEAQTRPTAPWFGRGLDGTRRITFFGYPAEVPWITTVSFPRSALLAPLERRLILLSAGLALSVVGTLALAILAERSERRAWARVAEAQQARERLELAREAQHHVRNALQVLRLRHATETDPRIQAYVDEAMERIEWVLRDLLPAGASGPTEPRRQGEPAPEDVLPPPDPGAAP